MPSASSNQESPYYARLLAAIRDYFPTPGPDDAAAERVTELFARALQHIQATDEKLFVGERKPLSMQVAHQARLAGNMRSEAAVMDEMAGYLQGLVRYSHPLAQVGVTPQPSNVSLVGKLYADVFNTNTLWDAVSQRVCMAEVEVAAMCADLVGYDERAAGLFTFGGTGTILYGVRLGIEKAFPDAYKKGITRPGKVIASDNAHTAKLNALGWLGLGTDNLLTVATNNDSSMNLKMFEALLRRTLEAGDRVACIIATTGSTDSFGVDDIQRIVEVRDALAAEYNLNYLPHVHADAVIGWSWSVFRTYDFAANPLQFSAATARRLQAISDRISGLACADSLGIDFHKTGYAPNTSSMFLCKQRDDLVHISRDRSGAPYLFHSGSYFPGLYTLETSRGGGAALAALANMRLLGREGFQTLMAHITEMAFVLRDRLKQHPNMVVVNSSNGGPVTLIRAYPLGTDGRAAYLRECEDPEAAGNVERINAYNHRLHDLLMTRFEQAEGPLLSLTERSHRSATQLPMTALKSFVVSPFTTAASMETCASKLAEAQQHLHTHGETP